MTPTPTGDAAIFVVKGTDPGLVDRGVEQLLAELTSSRGDKDRTGNGAPTASDGDMAQGDGTLAVAIEEHRAPSGEEGLAIGPVIDALATPPFLADRRIVVLRDAEHLNAGQAAELATQLAEEFSPNLLVMTVVGKALPAALLKAIKGRAREIDTSPGSSPKARTQWLTQQLQGSSVRLDAAARHLLEQHLGEDVSRLQPLLEVLGAAYGEGGRVGPAELARFSGRKGEPRPGTSPTRSTRATWRPQCGSPTACSEPAGGTPSSSSRCCTSTTGRCCGSTAAASPTPQQPRRSSTWRRTLPARCSTRAASSARSGSAGRSA